MTKQTISRVAQATAQTHHDQSTLNYISTPLLPTYIGPDTLSLCFIFYIFPSFFPSLSPAIFQRMVHPSLLSVRPVPHGIKGVEPSEGCELLGFCSQGVPLTQVQPSEVPISSQPLQDPLHVEQGSNPENRHSLTSGQYRSTQKVLSA